jgi:hypothetical protein
MGQRRLLTPGQVDGFRRMRRLKQAYGSPMLRTRFALDRWGGPILLAFTGIVLVLVNLDAGLLRWRTVDVIGYASVNVLCLTMAALGLAARRAHRRIRRFDAGLCTGCGHDLNGAETDECPECGALALV